jgi:hypothetical protein
MKNKKDILIGLVIGLIGVFIGYFIAVSLFTDIPFFSGFNRLKVSGMVGKLISLGAILNVILFFALLKYKKDEMARGVILSMFIITVITLVI